MKIKTNTKELSITISFSEEEILDYYNGLKQDYGSPVEDDTNGFESLDENEITTALLYAAGTIDLESQEEGLIDDDEDFFEG
jgi:hypothetical protein